MGQSLKKMLSLIKSDMQARCEYENKRLNTLQFIKFLFNCPILSVTTYRIQSFFYANNFKVIASALKNINAILFTVGIDSDTHIGEGFLILHANFIQIGSKVKIGKGCILIHQNSISGSPFLDADTLESKLGPVIGDHLVLGAGACITGNIVIGNRVKVGVNAAVTQNFPDDAVLFGVPARNLARSVNQESEV